MNTEQIESRLREIEASVAVQTRVLEDHLESEARHQEALSAKFTRIYDILDDLRISIAKRNGALDEARRHAAWQGSIWGGTISAIIAGLFALLS